MRTDIKIFNMDDCTWVAAKDVDDAWQGLASWMGQSVEETRADYEDKDNPPQELTDADLDRLKFVDDMGESSSETTRTFREQLSVMMEADPDQFPCFFATTEY
jgi:hypothetical protein